VGIHPQVVWVLFAFLIGVTPVKHRQYFIKLIKQDFIIVDDTIYTNTDLNFEVILKH
jgi:hypothetical protein